MLEDRENIKVSYSFIYKLLINHSIVSPKIHRITRKRLNTMPKEATDILEVANNTDHKAPIDNTYPRKERKKYFGKQIQMDASIHKWFSNEKYALHLAIDNYTRMIVGGYFQKEETLKRYYHFFEQILNKYGVPYCFFTDNSTIFNYNRSKDKSGPNDVLIQFGYANKILGTSIETSSVSQTKGMIERANETFQSRLVSELKL